MSPTRKAIASAVLRMFDSAACSCAEPYHSRGWKLNLRIKPAFRPAFSRWRGNFFAVRLFVIDEGAEAGCALDVREAAIAAARDRGYCRLRDCAVELDRERGVCARRGRSGCTSRRYS